MPRVSITEENRAGSSSERFAQLKLDTNEKARFVIFGEPWMEWVHELRAPVIEDGVAIKETRKKRDGSEYPAQKMEFIRRSICLGTQSVMADKGADPANCPACKAAQDGDCDKAVQRYAATIVRYTLRGATWNVMSPFSANVLIWSVTARKWDELIDLANKLGDLRNADLTLECEDGFWQRNKLSFEPTPAWSQIDGASAYIKALLGDKENLPTDDQLQDACGSVANRNYMQQDVDLIVSRWRQARNAGSGGSALPASESADLAGGLDDLLGTPSPASSAVEDPFGNLHPGGTGEFAGDPLAGIQAAKEQAQADMQKITNPSPLDDPQPGASPFGEPGSPLTPAQSPAKGSAPSFDDIFSM